MTRGARGASLPRNPDPLPRHQCGDVQSVAAFKASQDEREGQVLTFLTDSLCNKHIAARLDISPGTVKAHLRSAFDRLGVHTRTEAILLAERRGLLRQPRHPRIPETDPHAVTPEVQPRNAAHQTLSFVELAHERAAPINA